MVVVGIPTAYLFENEPKTQINIKTNYDSISLKSYLLRKVKKKKSKNNYVEIIGDYEYEIIVENTDLLLGFYKECQQELQTMVLHWVRLLGILHQYQQGHIIIIV